MPLAAAALRIPCVSLDNQHRFCHPLESNFPSYLRWYCADGGGVCSSLDQTNLSEYRRGFSSLSCQQLLSDRSMPSFATELAAKPAYDGDHVLVYARQSLGRRIAQSAGCVAGNVLPIWLRRSAGRQFALPAVQLFGVCSGFGLVPRRDLSGRPANARRSRILWQTGTGDSDAESARAGNQRTVCAARGAGRFLPDWRLTAAADPSDFSAGGHVRTAAKWSRSSSRFVEDWLWMMHFVPGSAASLSRTFTWVAGIAKPTCCSVSQAAHVRLFVPGRRFHRRLENAPRVSLERHLHAADPPHFRHGKARHGGALRGRQPRRVLAQLHGRVSNGADRPHRNCRRIRASHGRRPSVAGHPRRYFRSVHDEHALAFVAGRSGLFGAVGDEHRRQLVPTPARV